MKEIFDFLKDFSVWTVLIRILCAALMGGLIGSERGRHGRAAGLRTHILICIGAAITSLTSLYLAKDLGFGGDVARLSAQVISGIGFLGAGTILIRNKSIITGLTTAAGMWATASIGIAIGYGFYSGALIATSVCIISVTLLGRAEKKKRSIINSYIELSDISFTENVVNILQNLEKGLNTYDLIPPKTGTNGNVGILCVLNDEESYLKVKEQLRDRSEVAIMIIEG